jgi:RNA polymerase sigma-70 factor, ECF subfamily
MEPSDRLRGVCGVSTTSDSDPHGVQGLYEACYPRLVGVVAVAASSRAEAEECVQEAFIQLLRSWPKVSQFDNPEAWVRRVALRLLSNRQRKSRNGVKALLRIGPNTASEPPSGDSLDVRRALQQLPLAQRQVVVLHYLLGMTVPSIAAELNVAQGTVKSRLSRARESLHELLSEKAFNG